MNREKKLGRGLEFLLSESAAEPVTGEELLFVSVEELEMNPFQPRREFDGEELQGLAESIKANGILQPLVARRRGATFQVIAGERRLRAARMAGLKVVPLVVREADDGGMLTLAMIENLQRKDLNPLEKARACRRLLELTGRTQEEVADMLKMSRSAFTNHLRLLELPEPVKQHVSRGTLSLGHARALLGAKEEEARVRLAEECLQKDYSVREVERIIKERRPAPSPGAGERGAGKARVLPSWHREIEERLAHALSARVKVSFRGEKGRIEIFTPNRESFDALYDRLTGIEEHHLEGEPDRSADNLLM